MTMMSKKSSSAGSKVRPVRALIVDDKPQVRQDLRRLLELSGIVEVTGEAADGVEALRLASVLIPDVAVVDLEMPGMDGCELTARLKTRQPTLRVVILSVHAGAGEVARGLAAGADSFVVKGSEYPVLLNAISGKDQVNQIKKEGKTR